MIRVRVTLSSIGNGILMNPMTDETLEALRTGVRAPIQKDRPAYDVADERVIRDDDGHVGIPMEYLFSCLIEAGRQVKNGRKQISTAKSSLLPSFLSIEETFIRFTDHSEMVVDKRRGRLPKDGTAVCLVRPKFESWACDVTLAIDEKAVSEPTVKDLLAVAGSSVGLGDFRPACRGPFGRFEVSAWVKLGNEHETEVPAETNGHGSKQDAEAALAGAPA